MKLGSTFLAVLLIAFVTSSPLALKVHRVEASGTVYIRADGSIDPPTAPIKRNGDLYTLIGDINVTSDSGGIVVQSDSLVIDGAGFMVEGTVTYASVGIFLDGIGNVTIQNTNIKSFYLGIWIRNSSSNRINGNNITNSNQGIGLNAALNNSIYGNNITNNIYYGIWLDYASNNIICHNNFINNGSQATIFTSGYAANFWDNGNEGNYWRYYDGTDANQDGIGDSPYIIDANNTDRYPLMTPYIIPEFSSFLILPLFMITTLLAAIVYGRKHTRCR